MKKAKKLLSVFLAALMVMTTLGGVMTASAATEAAAQEAADQFNATRPDHSDVYQNMSKKTAQQTKDTLNGLISSILKVSNINSTVYSDQTLSHLMILLNGGVSILSDLKPSTFAGKVEAAGYKDAAAYIKTLNSWDEADAAKIKWGITPGDADQFLKVSGTALMGIGQILALAVGFLQVYDNLVPVMEAFHTVKMPTYAEFMAEVGTYEDQSAGFTTVFMKRLLPSIDALLANPVNVLCDALPDLVAGYNGLVTAINSNPMAAWVGLALPDFDGLVSSIGTGIGLTLPEIDSDYLTTMGEAYAAESGIADGYRMAIKGDQPMVFAALMNYVGKTLKIPANQVAFSKLIGDQIGMGYGDEIGAIVVAAQGGDALSIADASVALCESIAENLGIKSNNEGIGGFFAKVMAFFNRIARAIVDLFKGFGSKAVA